MTTHILTTSPNAYNEAVRAALAEANQHQVVQRIWRTDASLWKQDEAHQKIINNSLGWLKVVDSMLAAATELSAFAVALRDQHLFDHVMVCGMGGSSLCPEVLRQTFGPQNDFPELLVLDSTDPDQIADFEARIDIGRCLFVIASKSGTTTEPLAFFKYWYQSVGEAKRDPGSSFIAITDPGTLMEKMATDSNFRHIFLNPADIGGRYSALSYFGMAPAVLMGLDAKVLLERAMETARSCSPAVHAEENPGALLGILMAVHASAGRDKLTIVADQKIAALGLWIEQLIAESTGKEGKGILPVDREPLGGPEVYEDDRLFVSLAIGNPETGTASKLKDLEAAGHPVLYLTLDDLNDLGGQFFLWEFATAVAGWRLEINPFDQPNVQESKDATRELLEGFTREGRLPEQTALVSDGALTVYVDSETRTSLPAGSVAEALRAHLGTAKPHDYFALLSFIEETPEIEAAVVETRARLRQLTKIATTAGYGPRFLHSTGQFHKGGPDAGVFIQMTAPDKLDLTIPGEAYTFSILKQAQALGDFRALVSRGRRAIRVSLGDDAVAGLKQLRELL